MSETIQSWQPTSGSVASQPDAFITAKVEKANAKKKIARRHKVRALIGRVNNVLIGRSSLSIVGQI